MNLHFSWGKEIVQWYQLHESMNPTCLVWTVQEGGGGVMVFSCLHLKATSYYRVWLMIMYIPSKPEFPHLPLVTSSMIMNTHHVTKQTGIKNMSMSSVFFSSLASYPDLNPVWKYSTWSRISNLMESTPWRIEIIAKWVPTQFLHNVPAKVLSKCVLDRYLGLYRDNYLAKMITSNYF